MRAAVVGHPITHSLSPAMHRAAYLATGLTGWQYQAFDVNEPDLAGFLARLEVDQWAGLSLTRPLKQVALGLVDHLEPLAAAVGAVNTVLFGSAGSVGANTDVHGMVQAATAAWSKPPALASAAVLGGGATAASALAAVAHFGVKQPAVFVRSTARSGELMRAASRMGLQPQFHRWPQGQSGAWYLADLVVSTVPAGVADPLGAAIANQDLTGRLLLDVAYQPWPSNLAKAWAASGGLVASGLDMLMYQGAEQFRLMTGLEPPVAAMMAALSANNS